MTPESQIEGLPYNYIFFVLQQISELDARICYKKLLMGNSALKSTKIWETFCFDKGNS